VVRLLTPVVNDAALDETYAHAARVALGTALARLGMFAPALSYLEEPAGPVRIAAVDGALGKALSLRAQGEDLEAADVLADLYAANPEHEHVHPHPVSESHDATRPEPSQDSHSGQGISGQGIRPRCGQENMNSPMKRVIRRR
jgi:hypothetical protein